MDRRLLWNDSSTIYSVDGDLRITWCNRAFGEFAAANGAPRITSHSEVGKALLDLLPRVLRPFYEKAFRTVYESQQPWEHVYECSSAQERRIYQMRVLPADGELVVVNSLVTGSAAGTADRCDVDTVLLAKQMVTMCANCRRTRLTISGKSMWAWAPNLVERPPERCSHGLCDVCVAYYYPQYADTAVGH